MLKLMLLIVTFLPIICSGWLFRKKYHYTTATGYVTCGGAPIPYVKVQLKDKDLLIHKTMGTSRTNRYGYFRLTGRGRDIFNGKPDPFIRVEYQYSGQYGRMEVEKLLKINRAGTTPARRYSRNINFGRIKFNSVHCKSYIKFYDALKNFRNRAGINLPVSTLHIRTGAIIHGGTAYALVSTIKIPNSYRLSQITDQLAKHEIAHIARHSMDGSLVHFLYDVVRFRYARRHTCGKKSNNGYAFNEGWAEYWARQCYRSYGSSISDYRYEGNVAKALRRLKSVCLSSDSKFIAVLKYNRGKIHSFSSFNQKHKSRYGCSI